MMFSPFLNTLALSLSLRKRSNRSYIYGPHIARSDHRENQVLHDQVLCRGSKSSSGFLRRLSQGGGCGITLFRNCASQPHKTFPKRMELSRQQCSFRKGFVRLIGANSETKKPPAGLLGVQTVLMAAASAL